VQLERMRLETSVFVVISVIGQELLSGGYYASAVVVLESGLKIGTSNLKLKGSVFSALSSAYWALNSLEKVTNYHHNNMSKNNQFLPNCPYILPLKSDHSVKKRTHGAWLAWLQEPKGVMIFFTLLKCGGGE